MTNDIRKGLVRLCIVVLVPWYLGWSFAVYRQLDHLEVWKGAAANWESISEKQATNGGTVSDDTLRYASEAGEGIARSRHRAWLYGEIGLGAPIAFALLLIAGNWVWRGFRGSETF